MKKPSPELKDVLNPEEAVQYFGFSRRKFFGMLREEKFKKYTALYGRCRLILRREFEKYLEGQIAKIDLPDKDIPFLRNKILTMYANPLINYLEAAKS